MLDHLISPDLEPRVCETEPEGFVRLSPTPRYPGPPPQDILDAQHSTADWLEAMGLCADKVVPQVQAETARNAFVALTTQNDPTVQAENLLTLKTPTAVRHLTGMLTAYDWEFVHQAKEIRGYVVAKLIEESESAVKSGDRIKALTALGKVTEVGLFTEKVEISKDKLSEEELDAKIKERINRMRGVEDALPRAPDATQ